MIINDARVKAMCKDDFHSNFHERNPQFKISTSPKGNTVYHNMANKEIIEARKKQFNITNDDISAIFRNITGASMNISTLRSKIEGRSDFTCSEILILSEILNFSRDEMCLCFGLNI